MLLLHLDMTKSVMRALYGKSTSLNLSSRKIKVVPTCISRLTNLKILLLNNNSISSLPAELLALQHVSLLCLSALLNMFLHHSPNVLHTKQICDYISFSFCNACKLSELNLGNNDFNDIPAPLGLLESLTKLYLYSNRITAVPPDVIRRFCSDSLAPIRFV